MLSVWTTNGGTTNGGTTNGAKAGKGREREGAKDVVQYSIGGVVGFAVGCGGVLSSALLPGG